MNRSCLDCGMIISYPHTRCRMHRRMKDQIRNHAPQRRAYSDPIYRSYVKGIKCEWCGATEDLTKDHIQELILGGTNDHSNLQTLCRSCQSVKENKRRAALIQ